MHLTRLVIRTSSKGHRIFADYRSPAGKRVRLGHGTAKNKQELVAAVQAAVKSSSNRERVTVTGGM